MGQALLEQQEMNEMAERVKDYQLKALADQNETSKKMKMLKTQAHNLLPPRGNNQQVAVVAVVDLVLLVVLLVVL